MRLRTLCPAILLVAAVAVTAAGCAAPTPAPSPTPSTTSTPTMAPVTTPTATATTEPQPSVTAEPPTAQIDPADPGTWLIDFTGIGPITLGSPLTELEAIVPDYESCRPGVDLFVDNSFVASVDGSGETITLALILKALDGAPTPRTAEGITIGSTLAELQSAYPDLVTVPKSFVEQNDYSITDGTSWIHFDTYGKDTVQEIYVWNSDSPVKEYCG